MPSETPEEPRVCTGMPLSLHQTHNFVGGELLWR
jgi:hypothetical protein